MIGILTFHRALNYGALLQAYSLFQYLNNDNNIEIIDFLPENNWTDTAYLISLNSKYALARNIYSILSFPFIRKRKRCFAEFIGKHIKLSKDHDIDASHLPEVIRKNNYDTVICGSDQIWNAKLPDSDISFLLPNIKGVKKIAYAASIGKGDFEDFNNSNLVRESILDYKYISVREIATLDKLKKFAELTAEVSVVVDPTLLVDKSVFHKIASDRIVRGSYIFLYTVVGREETIEAAERLSKRTKLPVYTLFSGRPKKWWVKYRNHVPNGDIGPAGFLAMIRDANYVVTDSFHGTVFSLIFKKNSFFIKKKENGILTRDERIGQLCDLFQINERYIDNKLISNIALTQNIDWERIDELHKKMSYDSRAFLEKALESS